jgi:hypothetical protein
MLLLHFLKVQVFYVHKYNFIEKNINLALNFKQVITFD